MTTILEAAGVDYGGPAWSPDGRSIAVHFRTDDGDAGISLLSLETRRTTTLARGVGEISHPSWSADGSRLAFICGTGTEAARSTTYCVIPGSGGDLTTIGEVDGDCGVPAFMPDGVHMGVVCVVPGAGGADLFMLAVNELFTHAYTSSGLIAPEGIRRVVFDPDQHHAFVRRDDALWAIAIPGGEWSLPPLPPLHGDFDARVLE